MAPASLLALCIAVLLGAFAAPVGANTGSITGVAPIGDGLFTATFAVTVDTCSPATCGWSARATTAGAADGCAAPPGSSVVFTGSEHDGPGTDGPIEPLFYADTAGPFELCLLVAVDGRDEVLAEHLYTPAGPEPATCEPGPDDPSCGGLPVPAPEVDRPARLSRRAAKHAADRYLRHREGAGYATARHRRLTCRRVDVQKFRCSATWWSRGSTRHARLIVKVVSGHVRVSQRPS